MPTRPRWILASLVLLCVIIAPIDAPGSAFLDNSSEENDDAVASTVATPAHDHDHDHSGDSAIDLDSLFYGIRYPSDDILTVSLFSQARSTNMLPDPDEYVARPGLSNGMGGAEPMDFYPLSLDGTRVFPLAEGTFRISQEFGCVPLDPGYARSANCPPERPSLHTGIDLAAHEGTMIYAAATGTVNFADVDRASQSGNTVIRIIHDGPNSGYVSDYFHWVSSFVEPGDYVIAGQPIAAVGSIGYSTGPHLHFGIFDARASEYIEPLSWLRGNESLPVASGDGGTGGVDGVLRWSALIEAASSKHGIPAALIAAIMTVESGGNPDAVSPAGAQGLMQVMPDHLERYNIPRNKWRDPASNIDAGSRFLAELLAANGTLTNTVGAYFGYGCDVLGTCTMEYISNVFGWYNYYVPIFSGVAIDASQFDFELPDPDSSEFPSAGDTSAPELSPTPAPEPTPEPSPTPEPTAEPTPEPSPTPEPTAEPTPEPSPTPEPTPIPEPDPTRTPEPTPEPTPDDGSDVEDPEPTPTPPEEADDHDGDQPDDQDEGADEGDEGEHDDRLSVEGHGSIWVVDINENAILRINPEDDQLIAMILLDAEPYTIAMSHDGVWVSLPGTNQVLRIDPGTNEVVATVVITGGPRGLAVTDEGIWVANSAARTLELINAEHNEIVETVELEISPCDAWPGEGTLMMSDCETGAVIEIERG